MKDERQVAKINITWSQKKNDSSLNTRLSLQFFSLDVIKGKHQSVRIFLVVNKSIYQFSLIHHPADVGWRFSSRVGLKLWVMSLDSELTFFFSLFFFNRHFYNFPLFSHFNLEWDLPWLFLCLVFILYLLSEKKLAGFFRFNKSHCSSFFCSGS